MLNNFTSEDHKFMHDQSICAAPIFETLYLRVSIRNGYHVMPERVLVVGSGAAGTAAAFSLGQHPGKFDVELWEKGSVPGTLQKKPTQKQQHVSMCATLTLS